jgi:hypothetical protein
MQSLASPTRFVLVIEIRNTQQGSAYNFYKHKKLETNEGTNGVNRVLINRKK